MKSKCSSILKVTTALVLAVLMAFGSIATVVAAVPAASQSESALTLTAKKVVDIAESGANADLAETGATQRYIYCGISDNYDNNKDSNDWGFNFWGGTSGGVKSGTWIENITHDGRTYHMFRVQVYDDNNKAQFKGNANWWDPSNGYSVTLNGTTNNAVMFSHSNDGWQGQFQMNYQVTSNASLAASSTSITTAQTATLTPSLSSNSTYNDIKSTSYSVTRNSGSGTGSVSNGVFSATAAGTYTVTATVTYNAKGFTGITKTATATKQITVTAANTPLTTPTISLSSSSVTASPTGSVTLTVTNHSTIKGQDSGVTYELYKGGTKVTQSANTYTYSNGVFTIPARYSNAGTYTVKAIAANTTNYSDSATSSGAALTVNKQTVAAPTITIDKTDIASGSTATITVTNASTFASNYTLKLYKSTTQQSNTFTNGATTVNSAGTYKVKAISNNSEYYADSADSNTVTLTVSTPSWYLMGDLLTSTNPWTINTTYPVNTYVSKDVFSRTVTFTTGAATDKHYFRVHKGTGTASYTNSTTASTDMSTHNSSSTAVTANQDNQTFAMYVTGTGTFVIYVDQSGTYPKVWVTQNTWAVTSSAYTQKYNTSTGAYNTATASTDGGTVSPTSTNVEKGSSTTLTATAKSGYTFSGWYSSTTFTDANKVSSSTSYTFTPSANTTRYALFKQNEPSKVNISVASVDHATVTATWNGNTAAEGASLSNVPVGASVTVTVTPDSGYYFVSCTPTLTSNKFTVTASTTSITATVAQDATITAKSNKTARGTVTVNKTKAHQGDTITITVTPQAGILSALSYSYEGGDTYDRNFTSNTWVKRTATTGAAAPTSLASPKITDLASVGANIALSATGVATTYTFTMASTTNVTVNATFDAYSADSNWYYNGYTTSGGQKSGYYDKRMTEAVVSGEKFSYYEVTGRGSEGFDQLFTVAKKETSTGTRYAYFTRPDNWGSTWSNTGAPYAYFFNDNGTVGTDYPGTMMTFDSGNDFKIAIPAGATKVIFSDSESGKGSGAQTVDITMTATTSAYYLNGGYQDIDGVRKYTVSAWSSQPSSAGTGNSVTEYFYNDTIYLDHWFTGGFNNHDVTNVNNFIKPKTGNSKNFDAAKNDYYIVVLYPNTTYTFNNNTETTGSVPVVLWMADLPIETENVRVYAKDGAIRGDTSGSTYANIADTKIYKADGSTAAGTSASGNISGQTYETYKAEKGEKIVIKTSINSTNKSKYYVRGFCVNGEVPSGTLITTPDTTNGVYTLTYTIPEDFEGGYIEITPIYYLVDTSTSTNKVVTFRVNGFTDELKAVGTGKPGWGNTLYAYPYYGTLHGQSNAFGAYPGQPLVYYNGQYQMQIPVKSTSPFTKDSRDSGISNINDVNVSGITLSNGYWDSVHRQLMGYGNNDASADHVQTYDYDDFYKIYNEKAPVDNIVYEFKYRTTTNNRDTLGSKTSYTSSQFTTDFKNGFEDLLNYHGRKVDLFGTPLSGEQLNATPVYVVSIAGPNGSSGVANIAGYYATEWAVFAPDANGTTYTRVQTTGTSGKSSIPPSVLVLNDDDTTSFSTSTYPSAVSGKNITDWEALYTQLEAYRGVPVKITYEKAKVQLSENVYQTSGSSGATRCDGRWLYSKNGETITSTIKIQYSDNNGETYVDNPAEDETGYVSGLSAYFTNEDAYGKQTYTTTIDPDKEFDFTAKTTNGEYKFVGWYMEDGTKITSDNDGSTERSGSYTFVAKFMKVEGGQLILSHSVDTNATYQGTGTAKIAVTVKDGDETIRTFPETTSDIVLDDKIISSDKNYTVEVTLTATPTGDDRTGTTILATPSGQDSKFFNHSGASTSGTTVTYTFSFNVGELFTNTTQNYNSLIYHSYFIKSVYTYKLKFEYIDRFGTQKFLYREGELTAEQATNPLYVRKVSGSGYSERYLTPAFVQKVAPYESVPNQNISWNFGNDTTFQFSAIDNGYSVEHFITCEQTTDNLRTATFKLPYAHDEYGNATVTTPAEATTPNFVVNNIPYASVIKSGTDHGTYITAPEQLANGKYFQYWSIASTEDSNNEVARCYYKDFNFVAFDNYVITPLYASTKYDYLNSGAFTNITYLDTTRSQWNSIESTPVDDRGEDVESSDRATAADLLYNDFILNYNYNGLDIYKNGTDVSAITELGVVVERIQKLEVKADGTPYTDVARYSGKGVATSTIESVINGGTATGITKHAINKTALDNKNRVEFYDAFYNGAGWSKENQDSAAHYGYKNYVYKAYTYMKVNGQVVLCDNPAYFTMYDEAVKSVTDM